MNLPFVVICYSSSFFSLYNKRLLMNKSSGFLFSWSKLILVCTLLIPYLGFGGFSFAPNYPVNTGIISWSSNRLRWKNISFSSPWLIKYVEEEEKVYKSRLEESERMCEGNFPWDLNFNHRYLSNKSSLSTKILFTERDLRKYLIH